MNEQYRGFNLYGGCEPISETSHITPNRKTFFVYHRFGSKIRSPSNLAFWRSRFGALSVQRFEVFPFQPSRRRLRLCHFRRFTKLLLA